LELNTEDEGHLGVMSLDVDAAADGTEYASGELDSLSNFGKIGICELEDRMLGVGLDNDRYLDRAFKLVELGRVLRFGESKLVTCNPVDNKAVLREDILGFSSFAEVIVAKVNTASIDRYATGETLVLSKVSM
jgi:hypothetical protein